MLIFVKENVSIIISVMSLLVSVFTFIINADRNRKKDTKEAFEKFKKETLQFVENYKKDEIKEIVDNRNSNKSEEYKVLTVRLHEIDQFCTCVNAGVYDLDFLYKLSSKTFSILYDNLEDLVNILRKNGYDNHRSNKERYKEFKDVADKIKRK